MTYTSFDSPEDPEPPRPGRFAHSITRQRRCRGRGRTAQGSNETTGKHDLSYYLYLSERPR